MLLECATQTIVLLYVLTCQLHSRPIVWSRHVLPYMEMVMPSLLLTVCFISYLWSFAKIIAEVNIYIYLEFRILTEWIFITAVEGFHFIVWEYSMDLWTI